MVCYLELSGRWGVACLCVVEVDAHGAGDGGVHEVGVVDWDGRQQLELVRALGRVPAHVVWGPVQLGSRRVAVDTQRVLHKTSTPRRKIKRGSCFDNYFTQTSIIQRPKPDKQLQHLSSH